MEMKKLPQLQHRNTKRPKHKRLRDVGKRATCIQSEYQRKDQGEWRTHYGKMWTTKDNKKILKAFKEQKNRSPTKEQQINKADFPTATMEP